MSAPPSIQIQTLTRDLALQYGNALIALGNDLEWEYWSAENLLMDLPQKWQLSLIALDRTTPVGYAVVSRKPKSVHLHHLVVGPRHRQAGIGSQLLARLLEQAAMKSAGVLTLKVIETNRRAIEFYRRHGFKAGERQANGYIAMSLKITT